MRSQIILELPLFPGYFFTRFARAQRQAVITVPGIHHILEVPGGFATVSQAEIRNLRDGLLRRLPILPSLTVAMGDEVTIARGPFRGYEGFLSEVRISPSESLCRLAILRHVHSLSILPFPTFNL